jgi:2-oxoglutarate dehydrogenase E1 component
MGRKRTAVQQLIAAYRNVGQRWADLDPLKRTERPKFPSWSLLLRLHRRRPGSGVQHQQHLLRQGNHDLRELLNALRETYCGTIGAEYMYTTDQAEALVAERLESIRSKPASMPTRKSTSWTA